jgi:lipopolysaccharide/colanic/teichoic acid biosynthesis glycosyltransferase
MDEIPQLLNVLSGEMSLVGPRPELPEHVGLHDPQERRVLDLRPGLTGPASLAFIEEEKVLVTRSNLEEFYVKTAKASPNATHKRPR